MADVHTPEQRSYNMSRVRSRNTKPEMVVRNYLHSQGFRYRLHDRSLPGSPDLVLPRYRTIIFVHGCFYHGHEGCRYFVIPKTRTEWWMEKIAINRRRDEIASGRLIAQGWRVITVYECELKPTQRLKTLERLVVTLRQGYCPKHS